MYRNFFKLVRDPFEISPDPYFLYPTAQHQEALAGLYYGIKARKGFMVLTGEVGTGKTLVVRCLLNWLDKNKKRISYAYVFNSRLSGRQFLQYVAEDLGISFQPGSKSDLLIQLGRYLIDRHQQGLTTVLVIDEAQHLTTGVMEEVRLLTNLETAQGKLLQIVLVGQPELDTKLQSHGLRQLKQRVAFRFQLAPLSEEEVRGYIRRRLELSGAKDGEIFPLPAMVRIFEYSRGVPRLVNTICDNAMISAYSLGQHSIAAEIVDEVASDLRLNQPENDGEAATVLGPEDSSEEDRKFMQRLAALLHELEHRGVSATQTGGVKGEERK